MLVVSLVRRSAIGSDLFCHLGDISLIWQWLVKKLFPFYYRDFCIGNFTNVLMYEVCKLKKEQLRIFSLSNKFKQEALTPHFNSVGLDIFYHCHPYLEICECTSLKSSFIIMQSILYFIYDYFTLCYWKYICHLIFSNILCVCWIIRRVQSAKKIIYQDSFSSRWLWESHSMTDN